MIDSPVQVVTTFDRLIRLTQVVIWPVVLVVTIWIYRHQANRLLQALVRLAEGADEVKLGQVEIRRTVEKVAAQSSQDDPLGTPNSIPEVQRAAAAEIKDIVQTAPSAQKRMALRQSVRRRMTLFAYEYEQLRKDMSRGPERTSAMNVVIAKMRSLGLAAKPFLGEFSSAENAGMRLAAVAILQVSPSSDYLNWLFDRFNIEQPFIFFQVAVAVSQAVRKYGPRRPHALSKQINQSLKIVESFKGGVPDANTIRTLQTALRELQELHPEKTLRR